MTPTRYPLEPLAAHLGIDLGRVGGHQPGDPPDGLALLADALGISHPAARALRWRGLTPERADRFATRAGVHPALVWPSWWADLPDVEVDEGVPGWLADDPPMRSCTTITPAGLEQLRREYAARRAAAAAAAAAATPAPPPALDPLAAAS